MPQVEAIAMQPGATYPPPEVMQGGQPAPYAVQGSQGQGGPPGLPQGALQGALQGLLREHGVEEMVQALEVYRTTVLQGQQGQQGHPAGVQAGVQLD